VCTADAGLRLKTQLVHVVEQFRDAAAPLLQALSYASSARPSAHTRARRADGYAT